MSGDRQSDNAMVETRRPLLGLLVAQFFGAFNDNAFKMMITLLAIRVAKQGATGEVTGEQASQQVTTLAFVIFTLPLMLFSLPAMVLGDRVSKRTLILATKVAEVVLMLFGTLALASAASEVLCLVVLGLMGVQSAFFSPAKYGILPEVLPHDRLSSANALLEMWSFLAIILGTVAGGLLLEAAGVHIWMAGAALVVFSCVGLTFALSVPRVAAAGGDEPFGRVVVGAWRAVRDDRVLWLVILGSTYYWGIASLLGQDLLIYGKSVVGLGDDMAGVPLALLAVGVGIGAGLAGKLSAGKVESGLIPLGGLGLATWTFVFWLWSPGFVGMLALMLLMGVSSGFVLVPLNAMLQWRAPAARRGAIIALANFVIFGGILLGSLGCNWMAQMSWSSLSIVLGSAVMTLVATVWAISLMPVAFVRLLLVLLTHTIYRLRVVDRENVPEKGAALLVPNHVSFVDWLFLVASIDRRIRFVIDQRYFDRRLFRPIMKAIGAIPITADGGPRVVLKALREAGEALDRGEVVCIFAEGEISRTGTMLPFRRGIERVLKGRTAPIIPVHLDRVWGSVFSPVRGKALKLFKLPARLPVPITISYGAALPATSDVGEVRRQVQELGSAAAALRAGDYRPVHRGFVRQARWRPGLLAFADASGRRLSYFKALGGAVALARALRPRWSGQRHVGVVLPPSVGGALVNVAASLAGRASVNLNYTAGRDGLASAVRQAGLSTVVTSREFVEKAKLELPEGVELIWLEDVRDSMSAVSRLVATVAGLLLPVGLLERFAGAERSVRRDDPATIIFSSGSTGEPKGVVLTHCNVDSNSDGVARVLFPTPRDGMLGILPFFHSFGYMALWFASNHGVRTVFHVNPLDAPTVGKLVEQHRLTILVATPTFLQLYLRRCSPGQFGSLRMVVAGAEKLSERLAVAFEKHFGVRPLEGYGTTECAPVVAVNAIDYRAPGYYQPGSRPGTVGQPIPGTAIRIVDPETSEPMPTGEPGMLMVKGPNVMHGYLGRDDLTAEVLRDGWYETGDIAVIDEDGYLKITDRLSRFSKIGGEMVPHGRVEEALHEAAHADEQIFAVTAVPDEKRGERLIVLYTRASEDIEGLAAKLGEMGLPKLFVPKVDQFVKVAELPLLGTGKLDLREVKRLAAEATARP